MYMDTKLGDTVKVWPKPGLLVQSHENIFGRFVDSAGDTLLWTTWLHERVKDGSLLLTDPRESYQAHTVQPDPISPEAHTVQPDPQDDPSADQKVE